jgi:hypothetical protein
LIRPFILPAALIGFAAQLRVAVCCADAGRARTPVVDSHLAGALNLVRFYLPHSVLPDRGGFRMQVISRSVFSMSIFSRKAAVSLRKLAAAGLCAAAALAGAAGVVAAQGDHHKKARAIPARFVEPGKTAPVIRSRPVSRLANRYFVDFRSRTAATYGHAFVWYGRLNAHGKVGLIEVAGLHPASDNPIPYIIGHVFPVPAETGKSYGDLDDEYLTANYRVYLSEEDARKVFAYIKYKQDTSPLWLAGVYNCTAFIADIADYMGLKTPAGATWMYPEDMVNSLKEINGGREEVSLAAENQGIGAAFAKIFGR